MNDINNVVFGLIISLLLSYYQINLITISSDPFQSKLIWSRHIGTGVGEFYSPLHPVNNKNIIFAADRHGLVKALDFNTGKVIWNRDLSINDKKYFLCSKRSAMLSGGLSIYNNKIFVGSELGNIYALNIKNGNIIWQRNIWGEALSTLVISDGIVLVHTSNGMLMALNQNNGSIKWSINLDIPSLTLRGVSTPATMLGTTIVGGDNGNVYAILINKGKLIWQQKIVSVDENTEIDGFNDIKSTPIIYNGKIYISAYNGNMSALDFKSGKILWKNKIGSILDPVINNNIIYSVDKHDCIVALNRLDGSLRWKQPKFYHRCLTSPVLYKKYLIIGDAEGYLHWLNITTGSIIYQQKIDNSGFFSKPILCNGKIILQAKNGKLYVLLIPKNIS